MVSRWSFRLRGVAGRQRASALVAFAALSAAALANRREAQAAGVRYHSDPGHFEIGVPPTWHVVEQHAFPSVPFILESSTCGTMYVGFTVLERPETASDWARENLAVLAAQGFVQSASATVSFGADSDFEVDFVPPDNSPLRFRQIYSVVERAGYVVTLAAPAGRLEACARDLESLRRSMIFSPAEVSPSSRATQAPPQPMPSEGP